MMGSNSATTTATSNAFGGVGGGGGGSSNYLPPTSNSGSLIVAGAIGGNSNDLIPGPIGTSSSYAYGTGWEEFCDRHARVAAAEFSKACISYINSNLTPEEARNISHRNFAQKFVDAFVDHFDTEFFRRRSNLKTGNGTLDESECNEERDTHKPFHKAFFRRLSFKGLRKGKTLFHKNSEDLDGTGKSKTKMAKIVVECRKEGIVNNLIPESIDQPNGTQKWEKCRLALVKAVGGYMLEFYTPPKSAKPRSGVFCFLISEVRQTSSLEMPDRENTFVLKADNNMEYVIETENTSEMRSWLATIRYCMRTPPTQQPTMESDVIAAAMQTSPVTVNSPSGNLMGPSTGINAVQNPQYHQQNVTGSNGNIGGQTTNSLSEHNLASSANVQTGTNNDGVNTDGTSLNNIPDIPPRRPAAPGERGTQRLSASSNFDGDDVVVGETLVNVADLTAQMREYPWFHGTLPRAEAARMVLHSEAAGHGYFLVRQSETRQGEFVLTFNFQGRAKHLRMTINEKGQCRVQHLWFPSIQDMLEHFRTKPIPLESGGTSDVTLTKWVHNHGMPYNNDLTTDQSGDEAGVAGGAGGDINGSVGGGQTQQQPSPRHPQEIITMHLSVRLKTCEIELPLTNAQQQQQQQQQTGVINPTNLQQHSANLSSTQVANISHPSHAYPHQHPHQHPHHQQHHQTQQQQQQQQQQMRASTVSLQSHQTHHHQQQQQHHPHLLHHNTSATTSTAATAMSIDSNANAATGNVTGIAHHHETRAVDNQYSFV